MFPKYETLKRLVDGKVVAVIRGESADEATQVAKAAIRGGMQAIELTYTTPSIDQAFAQLAEESAVIGAGTVMDGETARHAILQGAQFIVSPHFDKKIATLCNRYAIPYLPGCMTIKEMNEAVESGCDVLKLFPANNFLPNFISSVNGPLPHIRIMPTGGINTDNVQDWLQAGAVAVGIGSDLTKAYRSEGSEAVEQLAADYVRIAKGGVNR